MRTITLYNYTELSDEAKIIATQEFNFEVDEFDLEDNDIDEYEFYDSGYIYKGDRD